MGLGKGKTEHAGARDMSRKDAHWGLTEEAKRWSKRARRRDERDELSDGMRDAAVGAEIETHEDSSE